MCVISLIVFIDNYYGHSIIFIVHEIHYTKYMLLFSISTKCHQIPIWKSHQSLVKAPVFGCNSTLECCSPANAANPGWNPGSRGDHQIFKQIDHFLLRFLPGEKIWLVGICWVANDGATISQMVKYISYWALWQRCKDYEKSHFGWDWKKCCRNGRRLSRNDGKVTRFAWR